MTNKGISLIVLVITIVVGLILISVAVVSTSSAISNAEITGFAKDLTTIKDGVETYYISNYEMPIISGTSKMNKSQVQALVNSSVQVKFNEELLSNYDDSTDEFYAIDLAKINVTKTSYGTKKTDDDIFVVSMPNMNIYYLKGVKSKGDIFFSLTSKLTGITNIVNASNDDKSTTTVISSGGVTITKKKDWTNDPLIQIETNMESGESLYLKFFNECLISSTVLGYNKINIPVSENWISNWLLGTTYPGVSIQGLSSEDLSSLKQSKKCEVIKKKNGTVIGRITLDFSKYDDILPSSTKVSSNSYDNRNTINILAEDSLSGIKEVRYEYLTKFDSNGNVISYYPDYTSYDNNYMKTKGKKATITNNNAVISAPKSIQKVQVAVIDNAGNINSTQYIISPPVYINAAVIENYENFLKIKIAVNSSVGLDTVKVSKSIDNITYTDEKTYSIYNIINIVKTIEHTLTKDNPIIYVKLIANGYGSSSTHIFQVDIKNSISGQIAPIGGYIYTDIYGKRAPIPAGFIVSQISGENIIDKGLVIKEGSNPTATDVNEFVWVPVDGLRVSYNKYFLNSSIYNDDTLPSGVTSELAQIIKYKGFYIGRYEVGVNNVRLSAGDALTDAKIMPNKYVYNYVSYIQAKDICEKFASVNKYNSSIKTGLVTGTAWDTVMKWLQNDGANVTKDSTSWGNYKNNLWKINNVNAKYSKDNGKTYSSADGVIKSVNSNWLLTTGANNTFSKNNIYDLAGNVIEWTNMKMSGVSPIVRGGNYFQSGNTEYAIKEYAFTNDFIESSTGFRIMLYID